MWRFKTTRPAVADYIQPKLSTSEDPKCNRRDAQCPTPYAFCSSESRYRSTWEPISPAPIAQPARSGGWQSARQRRNRKKMNLWAQDSDFPHVASREHGVLQENGFRQVTYWERLAAFTMLNCFINSLLMKISLKMQTEDMFSPPGHGPKLRIWRYLVFIWKHLCFVQKSILKLEEKLSVHFNALWWIPG